MKVSGGRARLLGAVAAVAVLGTAGCAAQPGAAAVIDGRRIEMSAVQQASLELGSVLQNSTPTVVLTQLLIGPAVEQVAADAGVAVLPEEARETAATVAQSVGADPVPEFSETSVEVIRTLLALQNLQDAAEADAYIEAVLADVAASDIQVTPRLGSWSSSPTGIVPETYPWLTEASD